MASLWYCRGVENKRACGLIERAHGKREMAGGGEEGEIERACIWILVNDNLGGLFSHLWLLDWLCKLFSFSMSKIDIMLKMLKNIHDAEL